MHSGQLLKLFMESAGDVEVLKATFSPMAIMLKAIKEKGYYDGWKVEPTGSSQG